ncbi:MAG: amidase [Phycisphaerales bacterium]|nr:MAG: amidase [Phycisphaerales bacterium]
MAAYREAETDRRAFLLSTGAVAASTVLARRVFGSQQEPPQAKPPTEEDAVEVAQEQAQAITSRTIAEAEKLAGVKFTSRERKQILKDLEEEVQRLLVRRSLDLPNSLAPGQIFDPRLPDMIFDLEQRPLVPSDDETGSLPDSDEDIAFAPVTKLSHWIERRQLSSLRLTKLYLDRLKRIGPKLECVVTLTEDLALSQARRADEELAGGLYRGPLHGIPWGAKDLFDTAGIRTSWGATPYSDRVPDNDAAVVQRLAEAGAVLIAKLTLGALAYGDIWFDGKTRNPWNPEQGSSGSSAGSAAATAAGLVGFALGTETLGSIVSPSMRCGTTGLRPTFGRVARTGAMALCWSLDKIGPIARTVEDCMLILDAINGADGGDPSSLDMPVDFDARRSVRGLRLGYDPAWFEDEEANGLDRNAVDAARRAGLRLVPVRLPDWPYETLMTILTVEAASAFEELTLSNRDDELVWQEPHAWPNTFRQTRFIPAIEYVQAERFRRMVMEMMDEQFESIDAMISPSYAGSLLLITNNTGHPSLTIRCGFKEDGTPHGITLWGRLFDEGTLCNIGMALEEELDVWYRRPDPA